MRSVPLLLLTLGVLACTSDLAQRLRGPVGDDDEPLPPTPDAVVEHGMDAGSDEPAPTTGTESDSGMPLGGAAGVPDAAALPDAVCGDGLRDPGEQCDEAGPSEVCDGDCTYAVCGDGIRNPRAAEECDEGGLTLTCDHSCSTWTCPEDCRCDARAGQVYAFCEQPMAWDDSDAFCADHGGRLAVVEGEEEHRWLTSRSDGATEYWLGAQDAAMEGSWRWLDGREFWQGDATGNAVDGLFSGWRVGQPNNSAAGNQAAENCLGFFGSDLDRGWNDFDCSSRLGQVCEFDRTPPASCGDGEVQPGEACDSGNEDETCDWDCSAVACGDGVVNLPAGEQCDDGNLFPSDACDDCRTTDLVAHWPMMETSGVLARGRVLDVDLRGLSDFAADEGLTFDGTDDFLVPAQTANPPELNFEGEITLSVKVKLGVTQVDFRPIVAHGASEADEHLYLGLRGQTLVAGVLTGEPLMPIEVSAPVTPWFEDGQWHHFAATFDGTEWRLYVDSTLMDTLETAQGAPSLDGAWSVGGFSDGLGAKFRGSLADLRIYSRAIQDSEVAALQALPPKE